MTAWGTAAARGCTVYCGRCGGRVAFREELRQRDLANAERDRVTHAVQAHLDSAPLCRAAETFEGREIAACRCGNPMRLPREGGLYCARCEGLLAPEVAAPKGERGRGRKGRKEGT